MDRAGELLAEDTERPIALKDPLETLPFVPAEWRVVRLLIQCLTLGAALSGLPLMLWRMGQSDETFINTGLFLGAPIVLIPLAWLVRRRFSRQLGTMLILGAAFSWIWVVTVLLTIWLLDFPA